MPDLNSNFPGLILPVSCLWVTAAQLVSRAVSPQGKGRGNSTQKELKGSHLCSSVLEISN